MRLTLHLVKEPVWKSCNCSDPLKANPIWKELNLKGQQWIIGAMRPKLLITLDEIDAAVEQGRPSVMAWFKRQTGLIWAAGWSNWLTSRITPPDLTAEATMQRKP